MFVETPASGSATTGTPGSTGFGTLLQKYLEGSNVNAVSEISDLIAAQRAYEMNAKVISAADEMMSATSNMR
jgi:flagellar basal-body rod protein FlgG